MRREWLMGNEFVCACLPPWMALYGLLGLLDECNQRDCIEGKRVGSSAPFLSAGPCLWLCLWTVSQVLAKSTSSQRVITTVVGVLNTFYSVVNSLFIHFSNNKHKGSLLSWNGWHRHSLIYIFFKFSRNCE